MTRLRGASLAAAASASICLAACTDETSGPEPPEPLDVDLTQPWETSSVSAVGGSAARVAQALRRARANDRLRSLLVAKGGRLVVEEYFAGAGPEDLHDVRSVTKSVVSALTGIAIERGALPGVQAMVGEYLDTLAAGLEADKAAITVEHLLTMTSGLEWDETGGFGDYVEWLSSGDQLRHLLDKTLAAPPGEVFNYNSAAVHLLGVVLEQAVGSSLPDLAEDLLFAPMGIERSRWDPLPGGFHNGGAGLDLRPRDAARFGQLFLQRGSSAGRRIVPAAWVDESSEARFGWRDRLGGLEGISYGLLWWVVPEAAEPFHFAWGHAGQFVVVAPDLHLVVVATSEWRGAGAQAGRYERMTMDVITQEIIPAFR